jgi:hypothetical protein
MTKSFLGKIADRIMALPSNDLGRFPTENCEKLANWVLKNFAFGPRLLFRKAGAWEREDRVMDGSVVISMKVDYRDRMIDRWDKGAFRLVLDRTGFPVRAEAVMRFGDEDVRRLGTQTDFSLLANLTSFHQLETIEAPFTENLDTMRLNSDWAFENMSLPETETVMPSGNWNVAREHGSVLYSRDTIFAGFSSDGHRVDKKGTFFVVFHPDGAPAGAWARSDGRPFALREPDDFGACLATNKTSPPTPSP